MTCPAVSPDTDQAEALLRARQGDPQAFSRLAQVHETRLFRQALALCRDPTTAEDLAAETLIEAWKSVPRFRGGCRFSTWLYSILVHRHQKNLRRQRARPPSLASLPAADIEASELALTRVTAADPDAGEQAARNETSRRLRRAVEGLAPAHQAVVLLRFFEGARLPEIAAALGIPVGTVKSRLHHALENLGQMPEVMNLLPPPGDSWS